MKSKVIIVMIFFGSLAAYGQDDLSLKIDKSGNRLTAKEYWKGLTEHCISTLTIGVQQANFFNTLYYNNKEIGIIKNEGGLNFIYSLQISPVMFDVSTFLCNFGVNSSNYYQGSEDVSTYLFGGSVYALYSPLLPNLGNFSKIVRPYLGLGYQNASLKADANNEMLGSHGVSGAMWKGGVKLLFGKKAKLCIIAEYQQSVSLNKPTALNMWHIGIGIGMRGAK